MTTRGEAMTEDAKNVSNQVKALGNETFARSDMAELVEPFVSRVEYYFKTVVFPTCNRRSSLNDLIKDLSNLGLQSAHLDALHELRRLYNTSKHNPDDNLKWQTCVDVCRGVILAFEAITDLCIQSVDAPYEQGLNTVVYVGFWDHYSTGETEIGLFLPSDHRLGTTPISTFHLPFLSWDILKPLLNNHPYYSNGVAALGHDLWESFSKEGDFLDAGIWEGDIRELLTLLSDHNDDELEAAVIPFLARKNNLMSVGLAVVSAAIDVARADPSIDSVDLKSKITDRANREYAADTETAMGQRILDAVMALLDDVPQEQLGSLSGPALRLSPGNEQYQNGFPLRIDGCTFVWSIT